MKKPSMTNQEALEKLYYNTNICEYCENYGCWENVGRCKTYQDIEEAREVIQNLINLNDLEDSKK